MKKPTTPRTPCTVHLHDSSAGIWFEHVDEHAAVAFRKVKTLLKRLGYALGEDPHIKRHYPSLNSSQRLGRKGELEVAVSHCGRTVDVEFFQNIHNVSNRSGGRYDFDKLSRMPYLMRKTVQLALARLVAGLRETFDVTVTEPTPARPSPDGLTAEQWVERRSRESGHFRPELGRADWHGEYNRRTADSQVLEQGCIVYFTDPKGRWQTGRAYYNLNSMWWVVSGRYAVTNKPCHELWCTRPEFLRKKDNRSYSLKRIEKLITAAVSKQDFLRAHALSQVLSQRQPTREKAPS